MPAPSRRSILAAHRGGKLRVEPRRPIRSREDLSTIYTPGVGTISRMIADDPALAATHTIAGHTVAVVSDGSAVLGLGNIGPKAAMPVMEGKAAIFKTFAGLDAFPICLSTQDVDEIVMVVHAIAPSFAAVNLEDIAAPRCFTIEERLQDLGIPVMHDDQHGTAVVVAAGLSNACRLVGKRMDALTVVLVGAGAAGTGVARLIAPTVGNLILIDSKGIVCGARDDLYPLKRELLAFTNRANVCGSLADALVGADVFIGVSQPGLLTTTMVRTMARDPIIFALANPVPEIMPDAAHAAGAAIVATGRSDFPNQVNNALGYPGIFKGALAAGATRITEEMKVAAALAIANHVRKPTPAKIIPSIFDRGLVERVARAVARAWKGRTQ